jgi:hypothetical protein
MDEDQQGVRVLEESGVKNYRRPQNIPDDSIKQISYLSSLDCTLDVVPIKPRMENHAAAVCGACGARSLHNLYIGYSFVERLCEICGSGNETSRRGGLV